MPAGFYFLIAAQFASGLADNMLLIVAIHFLQEQGYPGWWAPLLKFSLNLAYVVLAAWAGPLADSVPKPRLMAWMNALKLLGVVCLLLGAHPALAFVVVGAAASVYAPAKYGLVTDTVPPRLLVRANGWLEVSVVLSVVLGAVFGGVLVATHWPAALTHSLRVWGQQIGGVTSDQWAGLAVVMAVYGLAAGLNLGIRAGQHRRVGRQGRAGSATWSAFWADHVRLWRDPLGAISLHITTLYWGVGAVLQFVILDWAQHGLGLRLAHGAYMQALVALGVILGAALAARWLKLHTTRRIWPVGYLMAATVACWVWIDALWLVLPMLVCAGAMAGLLLVPMNAMLQHRGALLLSSGRSIAVQGFNENASVLLMLALYSAAQYAGASRQSVMLALALVMALGLWPLQRVRWRPRRGSKQQLAPAAVSGRQSGEGGAAGERL